MKYAVRYQSKRATLNGVAFATQENLGEVVAERIIEYGPVEVIQLDCKDGEEEATCIKVLHAHKAFTPSKIIEFEGVKNVQGI